MQWHLGDYQEKVTEKVISESAANLVGRIWARDSNLWKPNDQVHSAIIKNRLGWLDVIDLMQQQLPKLLAIAEEIKHANFKDIVLLGMGGSSLCPEVFRTVFDQISGYPQLHVLDTTDPAAILHMTQEIDPQKTVFIVSSKSGGTIETLSHLAHFWQIISEHNPATAGQHFVCITDPETSLADAAREKNFRYIFENPPDIGGRYSALSYFGLVPAAFAGINIVTLLERAKIMHQQCEVSTDNQANSGLVLGTIFKVLHDAGKDKITILTAPNLSAFSLWAEQLIAESTGKEGKGLIPIGNEPIGPAEVYSQDRLFVALQTSNDPPEFTEHLEKLRQAGRPMVGMYLNDNYDLAAEFFRWEFATAVVSAYLQIDPFDEPNVKESKDNTARILEIYTQQKKLPEPNDEVTGNLVERLVDFLNTRKEYDYIALMAYITPSPELYDLLQKLRTAIRDQFSTATTLGFGPRFLHSTGQLHKGGPNCGLFVQLTANDYQDVPIPQQPFGFSTLKCAQALGDWESLHSHQRRALRLHLKGKLEMAIDGLANAINHRQKEGIC